MAKLRITYSKSSIGYSKDQKATVRSLGLGKLNSIVVRDDTPATRGMIFKVRHLVKVEEVADGTPAKPAKRTIRPIVTQPLANEAPTKTTKRAARPTATQKLDEESQPTDEVRTKPAATQKLADEPQASVEEPVATQELTDEPQALVEEPVATQELTDEPQALVEEPVATQELIDEPSAPAADDLEVIEGIGPKIAGVLREAGISSFAELAATDSERLTEILQEANLRLASPETWAEQAELAAAGDLEGLKQLQDRLKGGRRE